MSAVATKSSSPRASFFSRLRDAWIWLFQPRRHFTFQYLFFLRFPIILGIVLFALPIVGPRLAENLLDNIFVVTPRQAFLVAIQACLAAWSIAYVFGLIKRTAPLRTNLLLNRKANREWQAGQALTAADLGLSSDILSNPGAAASLTLVVPLLVSLWVSADHAWWVVGATAFGILVAVLLRIFATGRIAGGASATWLRVFVETRTDLPRQYRGVGNALNSEGVAVTDAYLMLHRRAGAFALVATAFYLLVGLIAAPWMAGALALAPALLHVIAAITIFTWLLGWLSFRVDVWRIPALSLIVVTMILFRVIVPAGHVYPVLEWKGDRGTATEAITRLATARGDTLVVVAASGGGITASLWTAHVLDRLSADPSITPGFAQRISIISAVSGGAVGSLFFVDGFLKAAPPDGTEFEKIVERSAESSLAFAAWGAVYPDFLRGVSGTLFGKYDRGWALEEAWRSRLNNKHATLSDWAAGIKQGWSPIVVFNSTLQETGERWVLSPVELTKRDGRRNLQDVVANGSRLDLDVVTAARLSATFPYVSPSARPDAPSGGLHAADGGYYDNSGIVTALDMLHYWIDETKTSGPPVKRIAFVEIRASGTIADAVRKDPAADDLKQALFAPIDTLQHARTTSQLSRAEGEIDLARRAWKADGMTLEHFVFRLSDSQPLSWHLSDAEKGRIKRHWPDGRVLDEADPIDRAAKENADALARLEKALAPKR